MFEHLPAPNKEHAAKGVKVLTLAETWLVVGQSAVSRGKFGPLGRRYRVDVKVRRTPGDTEGKARGLLLFGPKEAAVWLKALR